MAVKEHVFFAIPTLGWTTWALAGALPKIEAASHHPDSRFRFSFKIIADARPADYARNVLVQEFLKTDASRLFFLDSDIIPAENLLELLRVNADIAAGLIPIWQDRPSLTGYNYIPESRRFINAIDKEGKVRSADGASTGVMIIKRAVLEDERMRLSPDWLDFDGALVRSLSDDDPPPVFREVRKPNGEMSMTEDLDFCLRAKKAGYSIAVHNGIVCGHVKQINLLTVIDWAAGRFEELFVEPSGELSASTPTPA